MTFETTLTEQIAPLTRRVTRIVGDAHTAEDVRQETLARAWRSAPRDAAPPVLRAWLHRTATNLALDELRRRARRDHLALADDVLRAPEQEHDGDAVQALAAIAPGERLALLLRHEAGLSLRELGAVLEISEDAARKRVARARSSFSAELGRIRAGDARPVVLLIMGNERPDGYVAWLERAGARVRILDTRRPGLDLEGADAVVLSGSEDDIDPRTYRSPRSARIGSTDLGRDLRDLAALRAALAADLPVLGVCRGAQLLTVLHGGDLHQDLGEAGLDHAAHRTQEHGVRTSAGSIGRHVLGTTGEVTSWHHQAVRRLGAGLRVSARSPDGLPEAVEVPSRRFALGLQWHPELGGRDSDERLAGALVEAACAA